jgi:hypothetical protein
MRPLLVLLFCAALVGGPARANAQDPPPTQPQPQQPAPPSQVAFSSDAGMIFNQVKADQAAAFEEVMAKVKEALAKSENPVRRQQAANWKVYKSKENAPGQVLYIFFMDPVVKDAEYDVVKILTEAFPEQARALYDKLVAAIAQISRVGLDKVIDFSGMAPLPLPAPAPVPGGGK